MAHGMTVEEEVIEKIREIQFQNGGYWVLTKELEDALPGRNVGGALKKLLAAKAVVEQPPPGSGLWSLPNR